MRGLRLLIVTLAAVAGVLVTASLGRWQLQRADAKRQLQVQMATRQALAPLTNADLPCGAAQWDAQLQRPVALDGQWLPEHTVWLDNRAMAGRPGLLVLTPLRLSPGSAPGCGAQVVLVQRGWVPRDALDRTKVPPLPPSSGPVRLAGRLVPAPSRLLELGKASDAEQGVIRQNVDPARLSAEWGVALRPGSIQQTVDESPAPPGGTGLRREWWRPQAEIGKHQAYAAQWFAMSAIIAALYVWFQWLRPRRGAQTLQM